LMRKALSILRSSVKMKCLMGVVCVVIALCLSCCLRMGRLHVSTKVFSCVSVRYLRAGFISTFEHLLLWMHECMGRLRAGFMSALEHLLFYS
jgi:hypothetical protein